MKVVVTKTELLQALTKLQNISPLKSTKPVLANVFLQTQGDTLLLTATDLSITLSCTIEAKVLEEGVLTVPCRKFFQLVKETLASHIKIDGSAISSAEIFTGSSFFKLHTLPPEHFPLHPPMQKGGDCIVSKKLLREILTKTVFAAAREDSRYTLNGVEMRLEKERALFSATDGKKLARGSIPCRSTLSSDIQVVLPIKGVEEMIKMLSEEGDANLQIEADRVSLEAGGTLLTSKLLSGQFPSIDQVIPESSTYDVCIHREELLSLLRQISLFTSELAPSAKFTLEPGQLQLSAASHDVGEGKVSMPIDYAGPKFSIGFNPQYFADILRHMQEETFLFGLSDPHSPGKITDSSPLLFVLMPMRLLEEAPAST